MSLQADGDTPLMAALASVRLKMNRQTMRFLGDAVVTGSKTRAPGESREAPAGAAGAEQGQALPAPAPPAEGSTGGPPGGNAGMSRARHLGPRASGTSLAWRRRRARLRVGAAAGAGRWTRARRTGFPAVCSITVRSPSVSILVERTGGGGGGGGGSGAGPGDGPPTNTTVTGSCSRMVIRLRRPHPGARDGHGRRAGQARPAEDGDPQLQQSKALVLPAESGRASASERTGGTVAVSRPGGSRAVKAELASPAESGRRPATTGGGDTRTRPPTVASNESLDTYVRRRATSIVHQVAKNMSWFERRCGGGGPEGSLEAATSRERLMRQVRRVAAYTAASRQLRHATRLYAVAGVVSRRARRGVVRYCRMDCPPRPWPPPPLPPPPAAPPPLSPPPPRPASAAAKASELRREAPDRTERAVHINDLPKRILLRVFSLLDQRELSLHVAPVCRAWHRLARSRHFWRELTFDAAFTQYSAQSVCQLLRATPGLWNLELIACRDVDLVLGQVWQTCRQLRTLVLDSCTVSAQLQRRQAKEPTVLEAVLEHCVCLQYLIVAFSPMLYTSSFFRLLGRRCWSLRCFLVSADDEDVRVFCESLSADGGEPGSTEASEMLLGSLTGSWSRTVPPPASPATTASDSCRAAHPPRETSGLRRRVTAVRTRNHLLRVLALRPDAELRLLQWRMSDKDNRATLDYFGVEARLSFQ